MCLALIGLCANYFLACAGDLKSLFQDNFKLTPLVNGWEKPIILFFCEKFAFIISTRVDYDRLPEEV